MSVPISTRLGAYEITGRIGSGGMGEVYTARDTRLDRTVAIKVLKTDAAYAAERFRLEGRLVARLNHPHICSLYDVGMEDGIAYLVMELVEGESLAQRLARDPLPKSDAILYGIQIASALDEAHRVGVVHRDLKPANVMISASGIKLLDFGIAKAVDETSDKSLTGANLVVGTPAYMAPEQFAGKAADHRSDIFAFGAVLYEMVTGLPASKDSDVAGDVRDPLSHLIQQCLMKDPDERWQTARDVLLELEWIGENVDLQVPAAKKTRSWIGWGAAALLAIALVAAMSWRSQAPAPVTRFSIAPPQKATIGTFALSPDGTRLVFSARDENGSRLWLRSLDAVTAEPLAGTDGADLDNSPFWSPDSKDIAFFAGGSLKRVLAVGGISHTLCAAPQARGGSWGGDTILFSPTVTGGLFQVPATGGAAVSATELNKETAELNHRLPSFLPDGIHFLFYSQITGAEGGVYLGKLGSKNVTRLVSAASAAIYSSGYLLYLRGDKLVAHAFDADNLRLSGDPQTVAGGVGSTRHLGAMRVSAGHAGALMHAPGSRAVSSQLVWLDRSGAATPASALSPFASLSHLGFSPDEKRVVVDRSSPETRIRDLWIFEPGRTAWSRFTFHPANDWVPAWSPDGRSIAFASDREGPSGVHQIFMKLADGSGEERVLYRSGKDKHQLAWAPDGNSLIFENMTSTTNSDLWLLPLADGGKPSPLLDSSASEIEPRFSPSGRWLAYASNASGRFEVFVQQMGGGSGKFQVSSGGGIQPVWRNDEKEMYFLGPDGKMMAVSVKAGAASFEAGTPQALFSTSLRGDDSQSHFAATPDGSRFLINDEIPDPASRDLTMVLNWTTLLKR